MLVLIKAYIKTKYLLIINQIRIEKLLFFYLNKFLIKIFNLHKN